MKLTLENFFSHLIFHPFKANTKKDVVIALVASIACGIFSIGICHAVCAIQNCFTHRSYATDQDRRVSGLRDSALDIQVSNKSVKTIGTVNKIEVTPHPLMDALICSEGIPDKVVKNAIELISTDQKAESWIISEAEFISVKWSSVQTNKFIVWTLALTDERLIEKSNSRELAENKEEVETKNDFLKFIMELNFKAGISPSPISKTSLLFPKKIKSLELNIVDKI